MHIKIHIRLHLKIHIALQLKKCVSQNAHYITSQNAHFVQSSSTIALQLKVHILFKMRVPNFPLARLGPVGDSFILFHQVMNPSIGPSWARLDPIEVFIT